MSRKLILSVIISGFLLAGCWDQKLIEQTGFELQLGIESGAGQQLLSTSNYPAIDSKLKNQDEVITVEGNLLREIRERRNMTAAKVIDGGKLQQILFSAEIAAKGILDILEILERDPLNPPLSYVVIVDGSPKELLEKAETFKNKPRSALYINQLLVKNINSSYLPDTKLYDFFIRYYAPGLDPITPLIKLETNGIKALGSALFTGDKMVGRIDTQQTVFLLAMMGQLTRTELFFKPIEPEKSSSLKKGLSLTHIRSHSKIRVKLEDRRPVIDISLIFKGSLVEYHRDELDDPQVQKKIEGQLSTQMKKSCLEIIKYTQAIGSDPIGIGDLVRAKYPAYWQSINWSDAYRDAKVNLKVKLDILQFGAIR